MNTKPIGTVAYLQGKPAFARAKHRISDVRSTQIERAFLTTVTLFPGNHICNTKDGKSVLARVSAPYDKEGELLLSTLPGQVKPLRYELEHALVVQHLKLNTDFRENKPQQ